MVLKAYPTTRNSERLTVGNSVAVKLLILSWPSETSGVGRVAFVLSMGNKRISYEVRNGLGVLTGNRVAVEPYCSYFLPQKCDAIPASVLPTV